MSVPLSGLAVGVWIGIFWIFDDPLDDGWHRNSGSFFDYKSNETLYTVLISIPEGMLAAYAVGFLSDYLPMGAQLPIIQILFFTATFGALFAIRHVDTWEDTLRRIDFTRWRTAFYPIFFYTAVVMGAGIGVSITVFANPDADQVRYLFQGYLSTVFYALRYFQSIATLVSLNLPVLMDHLSPLVGHMREIFVNNGELSLRAGYLGVVGGSLAGIGTPLILLMGMNAALIWGIFTGIQIRNIIGVGAPWYAPFAAYLGSLGLPVIGHTLIEFMAIILVGMAFAYTSYGALGYVAPAYFEKRAVDEGVKLGVGGILTLGFASFVETFIDPQFVNFIKGYSVLQPQIVPYELTGGSVFLIGLGVLAALGTAVFCVAGSIHVMGLFLEPWSESA